MADGHVKKKVLVVDDEPDVVTYLMSLLEDNDYAVITAADGKQAMDKLKSEKPDLVTLDISMPEKSGIRFYREVKEDPELKNTPVVVVTGVSSLQDGGTGKDFERFLSTRKSAPPPDAFIMKPIEADKLLETVKNLLAD